MITFCNNCKNYTLGDSCSHKSNIITIIDYDDYRQNFKQRPAELNITNNCQNFEPSLWYKVKRFFFKNMED